MGSVHLLLMPSPGTTLPRPREAHRPEGATRLNGPGAGLAGGYGRLREREVSLKSDALHFGPVPVTTSCCLGPHSLV